MASFNSNNRDWKSSTSPRSKEKTVKFQDANFQIPDTVAPIDAPIVSIAAPFCAPFCISGSANKNTNTNFIYEEYPDDIDSEDDIYIASSTDANKGVLAGLTSMSSSASLSDLQQESQVYSPDDDQEDVEIGVPYQIVHVSGANEVYSSEDALREKITEMIYESEEFIRAKNVGWDDTLKLLVKLYDVGYNYGTCPIDHLICIALNIAYQFKSCANTILKSKYCWRSIVRLNDKYVFDYSITHHLKAILGVM